MKHATKTKVRRLPLVLLLLGIAIAVLAWRVLPYVPAYKESIYSRADVKQLLRDQREHVDDPIFLYHLGRKLNNSGQFTSADAYLERAAGLDPDSDRIRDEWARALMGHGQVTVAFGILSQFSASHPNSAAAAQLLGKFYISREDWRPASEALTRSSQLAPGNAQTWALLANALIKMGRYLDARTALTKAISLQPDKPESHIQLAVLLENSDQMAARAEYENAIRLAPKNPLALRQYGRFLFDHGEPAKAEQMARISLTGAGEDTSAHLLLGRALAAQAKWLEAASELELTARQAPYDPQPPEQLRRAYRALALPERAAAWDAIYRRLTRSQNERRRLQDATQADPKNPALHHQFAAALAEISDVAGCIREEAFAQRTTPDNPRALAAAAQDLSRAGHNEEALPVARQAAREKRNPEAEETLADILLGLGRLHEAAVHYELIRDIRRERYPDYKRRLSAAAERIAGSNRPAEKMLRSAMSEQDTEKAIAGLNAALQLEPENTRCLRALLQLRMARKEFEEAAATAAQLTHISPEDGVAHTLYVAARLARLGDGQIIEEMFQDFDRRLQAAAQDPAALTTLCFDRGVISCKRGQWQQAIDNLKLADRLAPRSMATLLWLERALRQSGDQAGAQAVQVRLNSIKREQELLTATRAQNAIAADYESLAAYYQAQGLQNAAQSVRMEAKRRFGSSQ